MFSVTGCWAPPGASDSATQVCPHACRSHSPGAPQKWGMAPSLCRAISGGRAASAPKAEAAPAGDRTWLNEHGRDPVGTRAPKQQNTAQGRGQMDAEMSGEAGGAEAGEAILEPPVQT